MCYSRQIPGTETLLFINLLRKILQICTILLGNRATCVSEHNLPTVITWKWNGRSQQLLIASPTHTIIATPPCYIKQECSKRTDALLKDFMPWCHGATALRVQYKLAVTVHRCLRNQAPTYLIDYCVPVSDVAGRRHLRSAINWLFHVSAAAPSVAVPSLLLVLQSGIHCLTVCTIQLLDQSSFDGLWKKPVCLLLAFRWECVRGVLCIRALEMYIYLLTCRGKMHASY